MFRALPIAVLGLSFFLTVSDAHAQTVGDKLEDSAGDGLSNMLEGAFDQMNKKLFGGDEEQPQPSAAPQPASPAPSAKAPPVPRAMVKQAQTMLNKLGYDAGPEDGLMGGRTRTAIKQFQARMQRPQTGKVDPVLLQELMVTVTQVQPNTGVAGVQQPVPTYQGQQPAYQAPQPAYGQPSNYGASQQAPAYQGQQPAYQGQQPAYQGQQPAYQGQQPAYQGQQPAYQGQQPAYQGQQPAYQGQQPAYQGQQSAYQGQQPAYQGQQPVQGQGAAQGLQPVVPYQGQQPALGQTAPQGIQQPVVPLQGQQPAGGVQPVTAPTPGKLNPTPVPTGTQGSAPAGAVPQAGQQSSTGQSFNFGKMDAAATAPAMPSAGQQQASKPAAGFQFPSVGNQQPQFGKSDTGTSTSAMPSAAVNQPMPQQQQLAANQPAVNQPAVGQQGLGQTSAMPNQQALAGQALTQPALGAAPAAQPQIAALPPSNLPTAGQAQPAPQQSAAATGPKIDFESKGFAKALVLSQLTASPEVLNNDRAILEFGALFDCTNAKKAAKDEFFRPQFVQYWRQQFQQRPPAAALAPGMLFSHAWQASLGEYDHQRGGFPTQYQSPPYRNVQSPDPAKCLETAGHPIQARYSRYARLAIEWQELEDFDFIPVSPSAGQQLLAQIANANKTKNKNYNNSYLDRRVSLRMHFQVQKVEYANNGFQVKVAATGPVEVLRYNVKATGPVFYAFPSDYFKQQQPQIAAPVIIDALGHDRLWAYHWRLRPGAAEDPAAILAFAAGRNCGVAQAAARDEFTVNQFLAAQSNALKAQLQGEDPVFGRVWSAEWHTQVGGYQAATSHFPIEISDRLAALNPSHPPHQCPMTIYTPALKEAYDQQRARYPELSAPLIVTLANAGEANRITLPQAQAQAFLSGLNAGRQVKAQVLYQVVRSSWVGPEGQAKQHHLHAVALALRVFHPADGRLLYETRFDVNAAIARLDQTLVPQQSAPKQPEAAPAPSPNEKDANSGMIQPAVLKAGE